MRVRFAPSPTGALHIGGVRTALYNYLLAKKSGGSFIMRIEDTDQKRYVDGAEDYIKESLNWLGLTPDEGPDQGGNFGPYRQSQRKEIYQEHIQKLIDNGSAYYAFDTPEELETMRERLSNAGVAAPKYDHASRATMRNSLTLSEEEVQGLLQNGTSCVVRLKIEPGVQIAFHDTIRGEVTFQSEHLDDKVLLKADGLPTYHLANIVDDHLMEITHVIRGEEWLPSTAHHVLLYQAFGWTSSMPSFAHLPLILKPNGKGKLSKRDGQKLGIPVFPLEWNGSEESFSGFRESGFLPEAVLNFLAFLGWNPGTEQELFDLPELIQTFDLQQVQKGGARFDFDKAKWFNQQYILQSDLNSLIPAVIKFKPDPIDLSAYPEDYLLQVLELYQPRMQTLDSFWSEANYFFSADFARDEKTLQKKWKSESAIHFRSLLDLLTTLDFETSESLSDSVKGFVQENELSFGAIFPILRIAFAGTVQGPDLFAMMFVLGKSTCLKRLEELLQEVKAYG